ncbi:MAG TPA: hypothetical protein PL155_06880 [Candidatus Omnitrophota bacterium]|nr:hypothetical protein [Candidatus Omnitrophota bacterium]HPD85567.1 hypothetical protein [Candidatus Omnitrophota bacterium]HRZ04393.1 hypothetical protein [Candidatus Omnitrophota bacterium]
MFYVLATLSIFCIAVLMHILWCRVFPKNRLQIAPFAFFSLVGLLYYGALAHLFFYGSSADRAVNLWNLPLALSAAVVYILLIPIYLALYFNTRVESPTQKILRIIHEHDGIGYEELASCISDSEIIIPRIDDLLRCRYIQMKEGAYCLTARGIVVAKALNAYQVLTGREAGG